MQRWEYMKLTLDWDDAARWADTLNAFGADGWELTVGVTPPVTERVLGMAGVAPLVLFLKRPRQ